jgi:hypothetical protein
VNDVPDTVPLTDPQLTAYPVTVAPFDAPAVSMPLIEVVVELVKLMPGAPGGPTETVADVAVSPGPFDAVTAQL